MTTPRLLRLPLLVLLALLCACSRSGPDDKAGPDGTEIAPYQNIVFAFDEPLGAGRVNRWDTVQYVKFEPAVRGKFKWTGDRELVFSPQEPFRPATTFQAQWHPVAMAQLQKGKLPDLPLARFHTPRLRMHEPQLFWTQSRRAAGTAEMRANLLFNYAVKPADVQPLLRVTQDGKPVAFELVSSTEADSVVGVAFTQDVRQGSPVELTIAPGLHPVGSDQTTSKPFSAQAQVPDPQTLLIREVTAALVEGDPVITVLTNQPVSALEIQPLLTVTPEVAFSVEALESGFTLKGAFDVDKTYQVGLRTGVRGALGGQLAEPFTQTVSFVDERPSLSFAHGGKAMYLDALGARNLGIRVSEVGKVQVTIAKVYANNIQAFLRQGTSYGYGDEEGEGGEYEGGDGEDYESHSYQYYDIENVGSVVSERTYTVANLPKQQGFRLLNMTLKDLEFSGGMKGLYIVKVQDTERQWLQVSKVISVSDIGLIVKQGQAGSTLVFANSIRTARPLSGVTVRFVSSNNQVIGTGVTNGSGVALFDSTARTSRFRLSMLTAQQGADFTFLDLASNRVETSRFDVGGLQSNAARYQAFLYGDRDLYRPGDTVRTNTVVRTDTWQTPPANLPVKIRLLLPTGKEYASLRRKLSADGSFESRFILPPAIMTGLYTLEVLTGNDVLLASKKISVEEFMPDRLKVTVKAAPAVAKPGQPVTATLTAMNLFGPPAADRKFEVEFSLKAKPFKPKQYADYTFYIQSGEQRNSEYIGDEENPEVSDRFEKTMREGSTDATGRGTATYDVPDFENLGTLEGTAFATVFDESGRPVNRLATFEVQTQPVLFGIQRLPELVSTRQPMTVRLVGLTPGGQPTSAPARVQIVRLIWETVIERRGGRYVYNSQKREQVVVTQDRTVGSGTSMGFTPVSSGEYEVRVSRPGAETYVTSRFYAYGYGDTDSNSFEVSNEGEVTIEADKAKYQPGQTANLLLKTPFPGRVLVTVERNRVIDHYYVTTDEKSARISVPIKGTHVPNIYVTATAIREIRDNNLPLTVARGFMPLTVEKPGTHLPVAVKVAAQSRSQTWQTIEVSTAPRAAVTLAVVDEGILQLKDYRTPDPYAYFYQKRALEVNAFDIYPRLLPELNGASSTGGDGSDLSRRTTPVPNRRVKLLAKWSGVLRADANGKVRYRVRIPQFSGAVRVMAAAYKGDAFGSAEQTMRIADPVVISTSLPRFLSPGDTIDVPVTLTNTTGKEIRGIVAISRSSAKDAPPALFKVVETARDRELAYNGGDDFLPDNSLNHKIVLPPNAERREVFRIAASQIGATELLAGFIRELPKNAPPTPPIFWASERVEFPVRPASPLQKVTGSGVVKAGSGQTLNLRTDFLPATLRSQLVVSRSPMTEFAKDLRYLLQYPYGCLEQTVSAAFPQLYYADLASTLAQKAGKQAKGTRYNPNYNVQEAIRKIESQQLYNGSLSYWPGGDYDNWWTSAYAAHFLLEAQRAGFEVNKNVLDKLLRYLQMRNRKRETEEYDYFDVSNIARRRVIAKKEIAYSLYVLALAGRQDPVALNYYKANRQLLAQDSRFLLAASQAVGGNQRDFRDLLPTRFSERPAHRALDGSFYSPLRDDALILNALLEADPGNALTLSLTRQLSRQVKQAGWLNTQERAFALLALGKVARQNAASTATASLLADGKVIGAFSGKDLTVNNVANRKVNLRTSGTGSLYYFWETEGVSPTNTVREEDAYLRVRREFLDRNGQPVGSATFRQNDLVVVRITIQSGDAAGSVSNVAITDLLPAGLEIENPRIGAVRDLTWVKDAAEPDYLDVRDDRINLFTTATTAPKVFYYTARAVSKGTFRLGPVSADAMYNAEYHSYSGAGVVRVR
ncbi:alpha-2-macroglobulin family protein [Hymenobacter sp. BT175]|uniref:alpha-2-macroglobulin n=1 Tax=Hymenobacter translucens TaxID=2886507 RepID=UPI001D0E53A1|nr:MG2 domain-containing protein [Hymenobacter translucens]MCC2548039.1 alpha-2-macroglobulin family protein [Hymenobacter translucens]